VQRLAVETESKGLTGGPLVLSSFTCFSSKRLYSDTTWCTWSPIRTPSPQGQGGPAKGPPAQGPTVPPPPSSDSFSSKKILTEEERKKRNRERRRRKKERIKRSGCSTS